MLYRAVRPSRGRTGRSRTGGGGGSRAVLPLPPLTCATVEKAGLVRIALRTSLQTPEEDAAMTQVSPGNDAGIITKLSPRPVTDTVAQLTAMIAAKGIRLFAVIDQAAEARQARLELRDTTLVIFGNPRAGTPVMEAAPLAALDLPLKILIWDDNGQTKVCYNAPAWLAGRYHLSAELTANLTVIDPLTDALTAQ